MLFTCTGASMASLVDVIAAPGSQVNSDNNSLTTAEHLQPKTATFF